LSPPLLIFRYAAFFFYAIDDYFAFSSRFVFRYDIFAFLIFTFSFSPAASIFFRHADFFFAIFAISAVYAAAAFRVAADDMMPDAVKILPMFSLSLFSPFIFIFV